MMKNEKSREQAKLLENLQNPDAFIRKTAVEECRTLTDVNEEITRALLKIALADTNKIVAAAARQALEAPAHQAVLEKHTELKPEEAQTVEELPIKPPKLRVTLLFGALLGVVSAGIFALPVSLVKMSLAWQGFMLGFLNVGDNLGLMCPIYILGSALFGLLATWLGWSIRSGKKGNAWWGFLGGLIFDLLFVFLYIGQ